jgi:hypothetical protein
MINEFWHNYIEHTLVFIYVTDPDVNNLESIAFHHFFIAQKRVDLMVIDCFNLIYYIKVGVIFYFTWNLYVKQKHQITT